MAWHNQIHGSIAQGFLENGEEWYGISKQLQDKKHQSTKLTIAKEKVNYVGVV